MQKVAMNTKVLKAHGLARKAKRLLKHYKSMGSQDRFAKLRTEHKALKAKVQSSALTISKLRSRKRRTRKTGRWWRT